MKSPFFLGLNALAVIAAPIALPNMAVAQLSPAEAQMGQDVDAHYERWVSLLEQITNQNSGTRNLDGVRKVGAMMMPQFEALGFNVEWVPQDEAERAGHLIATHIATADSAKDTTKMLLIGHLDTVYELDSPFQTFERQGSIAIGPGAEDNKGGVMVIMAALHAMKTAGTLDDANIAVVLTGDEEDAGEPISISRRDLVTWAQWADVALDFEGLSIEDGKDMGVVARRSSNSWELQTTGKEGHSSGIFSEDAGDGAIFEMVRILSRFRNELPETNLTFNVGVVAGGVQADFDEEKLRTTASGKSNIIPSKAIARGDFRTLTDEQTARVRAKMQAIVDDHAPLTDAKLMIDPGSYPPMAPTAGNRALLARLNAINADLGLEQMAELDPLKRGAGDISFVARYTDGLVGFGPAGTGAHAPGEIVDLESIKRQAKRAAILMSRLAETPYRP